MLPRLERPTEARLPLSRLGTENPPAGAAPAHRPPPEESYILRVSRIRPDGNASTNGDVDRPANSKRTMQECRKTGSTSGSTRLRRGLLAVALLAGLSPIVLSGVAADASAPANTYKLSGAGKGTLSDGPAAVCLAGPEAGGVIELNGLVGSIAGYGNVASWTIVINENKDGTFKLHRLSTKDPTIALNPLLKNHNQAESDKEQLQGTSGTVTVHGQAGSMKATLRNLTSKGYGKTIKISGSWSCPAASG
jgi:hypothetical protein